MGCGQRGAHPPQAALHGRQLARPGRQSGVQPAGRHRQSSGAGQCKWAVRPPCSHSRQHHRRGQDSQVLSREERRAVASWRPAGTVVAGIHRVRAAHAGQLVLSRRGAQLYTSAGTTIVTRAGHGPHGHSGGRSSVFEVGRSSVDRPLLPPFPSSIPAARAGAIGRQRGVLQPQCTGGGSVNCPMAPAHRGRSPGGVIPSCRPVAVAVAVAVTAAALAGCDLAVEAGVNSLHSFQGLSSALLAPRLPALRAALLPRS